MYQSIIAVGRLGNAPELRYTPSGQSVCNFSLAVDQAYKASDGQNAKETTWFKVIAWGKLGEVCAEHLAKGKLVLVEGRVSAQAYIVKDGEAKASLELTANTVKFLSAKEQEEEF